MPPMTSSLAAIDPSNLQPAVHALGRLIVWTACLVVGPYLFFRGLRAFQLKRHVSNVPQSTVRAAAMGPVEVRGTAVGPYALSARFCPEDFLCCWYISETNAVQKVCAPLFVDDGTDILMVSPDALEALKGVVIPSLLGPGVVYVIRPGDNIFVLGCLQENPWSKRNTDDDLARIGPGFVSREEAEILRQTVAPNTTESFLATGDGSAGAKARDFDLYPQKILMKGKGPYLISSLSPRDVLARLTWRSILSTWGGPVLTLLGLVQLLLNGPAMLQTLLR